MCLAVGVLTFFCLGFLPEERGGVCDLLLGFLLSFEVLVEICGWHTGDENVTVEVLI